ncbi:alpha/beta fold hydrolase [Micromonospora gifhornensis]|uniref:alpha/beta fold hydrolase n=1 Tax=Micromonospora gifhornensis TaxID=84594 RepID=UPI001953F7AC|nr:alpha/beta fold hydrolase [Micromonospora gifhornensis]
MRFVRSRRPLARTALVFAVIVALIVVATATVYGWPLRSAELQRAEAEVLDFESARQRATQIIAAETADTEVDPGCRSQLLTHDTRSAKAVLLLHGYTGCPGPFSDLAKLYFDQGYNVWVPRAPRHGLNDRTAHAALRADELTAYANAALNLTAGLGDEVGVVGLSGGGMLATWLTGHRPDVVSRTLVLSPFYKPNAVQAPGFAIKPLIVLYGFGILPDRTNSNGFSYAALSQYLRLVRNFNADPKNPNLREIAVVTSANDDLIDHQEALGIPRAIADRNGITLSTYELPRDFGIGHDIVSPKALLGRTDELNRLYLDLYEGTARP